MYIGKNTVVPWILFSVSPVFPRHVFIIRRSFWQRCITRLTEGMSGSPGSLDSAFGRIIEIDFHMIHVFIYCKYDINDHDTNTSGWCVFFYVSCLLFASDEAVVRHEILHSSMRHKLRHKVFERRQTPSWYQDDFFRSQSKHVLFHLF